MGWKGDPCWYCRADLHKILHERDDLGDVYPDEFDRHMQALCIVDPQTPAERRAAQRFGNEGELS